MAKKESADEPVQRRGRDTDYAKWHWIESWSRQVELLWLDSSEREYRFSPLLSVQLLPCELAKKELMEVRVKYSAVANAIDAALERADHYRRKLLDQDERRVADQEKYDDLAWYSDALYQLWQCVLGAVTQIREADQSPSVQDQKLQSMANGPIVGSSKDDLEIPALFTPKKSDWIRATELAGILAPDAPELRIRTLSDYRTRNAKINHGCHGIDRFHRKWRQDDSNRVWYFKQSLTSKDQEQLKKFKN